MRWRTILPLSLLVLSQLVMAGIECGDYEKSVKIEDAWIRCSLEDPRMGVSTAHITDLTISPEVRGKRYSSAWFGNTSTNARMMTLAQLDMPSELSVAQVTQEHLSFAFTEQEDTNRYTIIKLELARNSNRELFEGAAFRSVNKGVAMIVPDVNIFGRLRWIRKNKTFSMHCQLVSPAFFEDGQVPNHGRCNVTNPDQERVRDCQSYQLWKFVRKAQEKPVAPKDRWHFVTNGNGESRCEVTI